MRWRGRDEEDMKQTAWRKGEHGDLNGPESVGIGENAVDFNLAEALPAG
jgi:hypothetical protein